MLFMKMVSCAEGSTLNVMGMRAFHATALVLVTALGAAGCLGSGSGSGSGSEARMSRSERQSASKPSLTERASRLPDPLGPSSDTAPAAQGEAEAQPVSVPIEGSDLVRGRSTVTVSAPIAKVREAVLDFAHYAEFMPHYSNCRVLGRTPTGAREVYMEITALHGAVKMWTRVELPKATTIEGVETWETRFIEGNVEDFKAIWRLRRVDDTHTELSLEVFLKPKIPLPTDLLNEENLSGSTKGVLAMRAHAEKGQTQAPAPAPAP
jgi:ribosome-associated toxin RatA of RatAB toxin-antitoxin module